MVNLLKGLVELKYRKDEMGKAYSIKFFRIFMIQFTELNKDGIFWAVTFHISKIAMSVSLENYDQKGWLLWKLNQQKQKEEFYKTML